MIMRLQGLKYRTFTLYLLLFFTAFTQAEIPDDYYKNANGKKSADLKTALFTIIRNHRVLEYYSSSNSFQMTDWHPATLSAPDGYFWDMYSSFQRTSWTSMYLNREHSLPKSWWSTTPESTVAYSDLHNLYPSDVTANMAKSNYPLGEVAGLPSFDNGVTKVGRNGLAFIGINNSTVTYNGTVFEPADEYKGDFARNYMYIITSYEDYAQNWRSAGTSMLNNNTYPVFNAYGSNLIMKWSRKDPVSSKEIARNNAVFMLQGNRNPFIDHPEMAEFLWGKYVDEIWIENSRLPEELVPFALKQNPVDNFLSIQINYPDQCSYLLKNVGGITLKKGKFSVSGTLNVSNLDNGIYFIEIFTANKKRIVEKFIVQH